MWEREGRRGIVLAARPGEGQCGLGEADVTQAEGGRGKLIEFWEEDWGGQETCDPDS